MSPHLYKKRKGGPSTQWAHFRLGWRNRHKYWYPIIRADLQQPDIRLCLPEWD